MSKTAVTIEDGKFKINGEYTYKNREWNGIEIEGLLLNTRMVQGIFDDRNEETVSRWAYPDTGEWDPDRNTGEFVEAMPLWKDHGVLAFTINLQGGSPEGYSEKQPWINSAFLSDGSLDEKYMNRLEQILDRADELGMAVILGYFYFGQDGIFPGDREIKRAVENATNWILDKGYTNVLIELDNECDVTEHYTHQILTPEGVHRLIKQVKEIDKNDRLLVSTSFKGGSIPTDEVMEVSDFLLVHGNGVEDPCRIEEMVKNIRNKGSYKGQPILFNEDDHYDFDKPVNNMIMALENGASWGFFDWGGNDYVIGYQNPPVNWKINTDRKKAFFELAKEITGYCSHNSEIDKQKGL
ncbi:MAG: hypothetical protein ACOCQN_03110 [Halanaerobiaceae bacterium]